VSGINRPTQALIDHSLYLSGATVAHVGASGFIDYYTISNPSFVKIKAFRSSSAPTTSPTADRLQSQLIVTKELGSGSSLKNSTYVESRTSDKYEPASPILNT